MVESSERAKLAVPASLTGSLHAEIDVNYCAEYTSINSFHNITQADEWCS